MCLVRQPRLACALSTAGHRPQYSLGSGKLAADRAYRNATLANAEKGTQVACARRIKDYALAEFVMGDPFAGLELSFRSHAPTSGDPQVEQTSSLAAFTEQDLLRILVCLTPQNTTEREQVVAVRGRAAPLDGIRGGMKLDPAVT